MTTPLLQSDFYKQSHYKMYPANMTKLYSNLTPRKSRMPGVNEVVVFGFQYFVKEYLIKQWNESFFHQDKAKVITKYKRLIDYTLGKDAIDTKHIEELHDLGFLPLVIKALPEGTLCPIGVPCMTITNTHPKFGWLVNFFETIISCTTWQPMTSATIAYQYRKLLEKYAMETVGNVDMVKFQGHDFSMRGMSSLESACVSGAGHLLSFVGTDTIPAIEFLEEYYHANIETELVGTSVPATEHSVMCAGTKEDEIETFKRLLDLYPTGILSVVSDTWNLWKVCTEYLPALKDQIMARDGKLVIRPDSGDPVDIICGINSRGYIDLSKYYHYDDSPVNHPEFFWDSLSDGVQEDTPHGECGPDKYSDIFKINGVLYKATVTNLSWNRYDKQYYYLEMWEKPKIVVEEIETTPQQKGVIELLWDVFGGTVNALGYKELDPHIGAIYGDSITLERADEICKRLKAKGFASTNIVFGIGSYTYQYNTRDTFGFAVKATYAEISHVKMSGVSVEEREIYKDPITDDGTKKSKKGLLRVTEDKDGKLIVIDQCSKRDESNSMLTSIFKDGYALDDEILSDIRKRLSSK